ncbi:helix-turn-helix domain-containing protein [Salicibibacter kimchii]|uniref:XRE family transcriptional regulator n=1 Tax=Salicibibacter kimchii TaxID=2099786 RepID=A0A345C090_9BACI|nr:helix-turn-helix transcriptional regulator [Salicibibacter kimchii]AXF56621.1 XRE family transcriptional regulator [Salicibibacter kimchii]
METTRAGGRVRAFRKLKGYTQQSFAKKMHMSVSVVGEIERGTRPAEEDFIKRASDLLDVSMEELLGENQFEDQSR